MKSDCKARLAFLFNAAALAAGLVACGGGQGAADAGTAVAGSPAVPPAPALLWGDSLPLRACEPSGKGTDFQVGDGKQFTALDQVPWESLNAGATVRIFYRAAPYTGKFMIAAKGTAVAPVRVCGVKGPNGERPVIDGSGATTRSTLSTVYGGDNSRDTQEARGIINIKAKATDPWESFPAYIQIDGLNIKRGHPNYSFKNAAGVTRSYGSFGACIWVDRGHNILIADNEISDCQMAVFSKSVDGGDFELTKNLRIAGNYMWGHGIVGDDHMHTTYTQSVGMVIEFNHYGPLRSGAWGNGPKDRSVGTVIRYNRIEGGAHAIDLVEAQDYPEYALRDPAYRTTYVYGNQIRKSGNTGSFFHYGGDTPGSSPGNNWGEPIYRKGTLYFFHNTVYVTDGSPELFQLDTTEEKAEVWNNIFVFDASVLEGQRRMRAQREVGASWTNGGILNLGRNWISDGWSDSDEYHPVQGQLNGAANMIVGSTSPIDTATMIPLSGSAAIDVAEAAPNAAAAAIAVNYQLDTSYAPTARAVKGSGMDLGAVER